MNQLSNNIIVDLDFCYTVSIEEYIRRILILGTIKNKYNSTTNKLDPEAELYIKTQIELGNGQQILTIVEDIYISGRAPKQDMTFMIHALLCRTTDIVLRKNALELLKKYRTLSQIYLWKTFHADILNDGVKSKGYGRAVKRVINQWILSQSAKQLAYQVTKYQQRGKWGITHIMQCAHPKTGSGDDRIFINKITGTPYVKKIKQPSIDATTTDLVLRYTIYGYEEMVKLASKYNLLETNEFKYLTAINWAKTCKDLNDENILTLIENIQSFELTREQISTESLGILDVQKALLVNKDKTKITMPFTALLRNLSNLTRLGVFEDREILELVLKHFNNQEIIIKARIHPVNILLAWFTYRTGYSDLSKHTWIPNLEIINILEKMFYLSFKTIEPTGKRICILIDASGSMTSPSVCKAITNAEAAAVLAMTISRAEANTKQPVQHTFYLFTSKKYNNVKDAGLTNVSDLIHSKATFTEVLSAVQRSDWASTDISLGITEAIKFKQMYDAFIVITDNDVNSGIKPSDALKQYRDIMKIDAKLAVIATQGSDISIADPNDKGMMDFVGFDTHAPKMLQEFISNKNISDSTSFDSEE